jgi:DNA-directed RNA polymerase I, II, and III subunit RPABC3
VDLTLDTNSELLELKEGERATIALAATLNMDGTMDDGQFQPYPGPSLMDSYDYVMHGRIFKIEAKEGSTIEIFASFGGTVLMCSHHAHTHTHTHIRTHTHIP